MRNLKKFLALVLAMMMALSLMATASASDFSDADDVTPAYTEAVNVLTELGVIRGYEDGTFHPEKSITRAETAAILYRIVTGDVEDKNVHLYEGVTVFKDVAEDAWYAPYVNYCADNGLIRGVGNDRYAPHSNVTGYQTLVMILRAIGYNNADEFSGADWKLKASGYGSKLGITRNIPTGSLGAAATREMVVEIMFKGIQTPMVNYNFLLGYTTDLLVDANAVNTAAGNKDDGTKKVIYAKDVPNTLLYQTFKIVGTRTVLGSDNYGRPQTEWVKDLATDTVANGGKYIPNFQTAVDTCTQVANGATPDATYYDADTNFTTDKRAQGVEATAVAVALTPVKVYKGTVVTECQFTTDVNGDKAINATLNITEYLNGGKVATRGTDTGDDDNNDGIKDDNVLIDALHTQEGTIGAAGRITEVYKPGTKGTNGKDNFIIVYVDTFLGVVTNVVPRTFDTAGNHVMSSAELHVKVNDTVTDVVEKSDEKDFDYKVGDLVLMTTYGFKNDNGEDPDTTSLDVSKIQTSVPTVAVDFLKDNSKNTSWAVDSVGKPTSEDVTVNGTFGTKNHKTGIETNNGDRMANVVYLASANDVAGGGTNTGVPYYQGDATTPITTQTTVPSTSPYNYGYRMVNAAIGKSYTIYKDANGYVVGMTAAEAGSDIGIVGGYEPVRIGTGKYAVEVTLFMADGTEKTVRMLKGASAADGTAPVDGTEPTHYLYFNSINDADTSFSAANLNIKTNVLVKIKAYTKDGATYYKPVETNEGAWKNYTQAIAAEDDNVVTGVANTLFDGATYDATPGSDTIAGGAVTAAENVDNNTKFIIAEVNWDYSMNEGNVGGYNDLELSVYTGFKNIPTIEGGAGNVEYQRIDNTVYVHPDEVDDDLEYTVKKQPTYAVDDTYLVYATGVTYQSYSTYKALKNGEPVDLKVSNNNLTLVNNKIEAAMATATVALIRPSSTNSAGYVTDVDEIKIAATTGGVNRTHTIAAATAVSFDKTGVIYLDAVASHPTDATDTTGVNFLTVSDDCVVRIVNLETGKYYTNANLDSIGQYENYTGSHAFVYELDQYGYISTIYIID